jgi:hypothetical protein
MHVPSLLDYSQFRQPADGYGVGIMLTTQQQFLSSTSNLSQFLSTTIFVVYKQYTSISFNNNFCHLRAIYLNFFQQQFLSSTSNISQFLFCGRLKKHKENVHRERAVDKAWGFILKKLNPRHVNMQPCMCHHGWTTVSLENQLTDTEWESWQPLNNNFCHLQAMYINFFSAD